MVGVTGFEPAAPCSQSTCATKLRYTPLGLCPQETLIILSDVPAFVNRFFMELCYEFVMF